MAIVLRLQGILPRAVRLWFNRLPISRTKPIMKRILVLSMARSLLFIVVVAVFGACISFYPCVESDLKARGDDSILHLDAANVLEMPIIVATVIRNMRRWF